MMEMPTPARYLPLRQFYDGRIWSIAENHEDVTTVYRCAARIKLYHLKPRQLAERLLFVAAQVTQAVVR